jgi:hypothetical protein
MLDFSSTTDSIISWDNSKGLKIEEYLINI